MFSMEDTPDISSNASKAWKHLISTTVQTNRIASIQNTKQQLVPGNEKEHARPKENSSVVS